MSLDELPRPQAVGFFNELKMNHKYDIIIQKDVINRDMAVLPIIDDKTEI